MQDSFVEALNTLLTGSGISNNELGRRIDVDPAQIGRWRKGRGRPRPENLVRAAAVFGVDHAWLWSLAYPEGMPDSTGPSDPQWTAFVAEIEAGWRSMDVSSREMAARGARALFAVQPTRETNGHRDGSSNTHPGGRRALDRHQWPSEETDSQGGLPTVYPRHGASRPAFSVTNALTAFKRLLVPSSAWTAAQPVH